MIYEPAYVLSLDDDPRYAWVQSASQAGCARCAAGQGCGNGLFSRLLGTRLHRIRVLNKAHAVQGDRVMIGLSETALLRGAFFAYGLPIILLLAGAMLGGLASEWLSLLGALTGLGGGLLVMKFYSKYRQHSSHFQPILMRLLDEHADCR